MDNRKFLDAVILARRTLPHGKRPTDLHVTIAAKLAYWRSPTCRHRALARAARCSTRSVIRAFARLHALGLLSWTRRVVFCTGWRAQVASIYDLGSCKPLAYASLRIREIPTFLRSAKLAQPVSGAGLALQRAREGGLMRMAQVALAMS